MHQLASALETRNFALLETLLVEDINFTSPVGSHLSGKANGCDHPQRRD